MKHPPLILEILTLPLVGILAIEALHTRANELILLAIPFLVVVFRMAIAQFQVPMPQANVPIDIFRRSVRNCIALNHAAGFVLMMVECGAVVAANPTVPSDFWLVIGGIYFVYVLLRFASRYYWIVAVTPIDQSVA